MAVAEYYVDPATASNGGDGTIGTPWTRANRKVIQFALDTITGETTGVRINVKAGGESQDALLDIGVYIAAPNTSSAAAPLIIQGYTSAAGDGGVAVIDSGNSNVTDFGTDFKFVHWRHLHVKNASTGIHCHTNCSVIECEVEDCSGSGGIYLTSSSNTVIGCFAHDCANYGIRGSDGNLVYRNLVIDTAVNHAMNISGIEALNGSSTYLENIVYINNGGAGGIRAGSTAGKYIGNSIFQLANTGNKSGIDNNSVSQGVYINNLVEGWKGSGGKGINYSTTSFNISMGNAVFDCETPYTDVGPIPSFGDDETLSATPFDGTNFGTPASVTPADFVPQDTGNVKYGSVPRVIKAFE